MNEVKPGDVVALRSGSPEYTVERIDRKGVAHCVRFKPESRVYSAAVIRETYAAAALRVVEPD